MKPATHTRLTPLTPPAPTASLTRTSPPALLGALALALALALANAGCATTLSSHSDRHTIITAGTHGTRAYWTPTADDITRIEEKLGRMFHDADARITGLPDNIPPYPLSDYCVRYTGAGPADNRYILGEAMLKTLPDAAALLDNPAMPLPDKGDARCFTVMYDMQTASIVAVRFLTQQ